METLFQDIRYGARMLWKHRGFTIIAVITLALGIGANTAIFSLVYAVLIKPLPFPDSERLVMVWEDQSSIGFPRSDAAPGNYTQWKAEQSVFEDMAGFTWKSFNLTGDGEPERIVAHGVTANFFGLLGVQPAIGRDFLHEEDKPGGPKTTILSHGLWQRRWGSDSSILGQDILLDGEKYRVVGVMPARFQFINREQSLWVPAMLTQEQLLDRDNHYLTVVARMKPGISLEQAQTDIKTITQRIARDYPEEAEGISSAVVPLREQLAGTVRSPLILLLVAAGLVLLIACSNIASLQLSRASDRSREIAVRAALGAGRARIVRQLLAESVLLACAGGAAGLLVTLWSFTLLRQLIPASMTTSTSLTIDLGVLGFTLVVSVLTGIIFGMVPALRSSKIDLNQTLKQGGRWGAIDRRNRLGGAFVVTQVALALGLLIGASLMIQTIINLRAQYSLFQPERLLTLRTALSDSKFADLGRYVEREHPARIAFYDQVLERVNALPGVISAGYTTSVPLQWKGGANGFTIENRAPEPGVFTNAIHRQVSSGYFQTMGIALRSGRYFDQRDQQNSQPVAIINETMARQYWSNDPLGKRFKLGVPDAPWVTIVGIVADVRQMGMDVPVKAEMYLPYRQIASHPWYAPRDLVIRTAADPMSLVAPVRREIHALDPRQPVSNVATMDELLTRETGTRRLGMILLGIFAGVALLLACLGIYGVLSYLVAQQTPDIGIRLALGAQQRDILALVLKRGMAWTLVGIAIGLVAAFVLVRLMASLLFGIRPTDPITFAVVPLILMGVALLACYLPARRAAKVDPLVALRYE
ncbi:MAG TPA: ABC transporter permease [Pyrinomonadaceae bacterium]|nr:ABC transporter permease [Pyrinomonadaceae bacterium]